MANTKVVTKSLAGGQDLLLTPGTTMQSRAGVAVGMQGIYVPMAVETTAQLTQLDSRIFKQANLVGETDVVLYTYSETDESGVVSIYGGSWIKQSVGNFEPAYINRMKSFALGNILNFARDGLFNGADSSYYVWTGTLPKTVPPGSTPASTGGVGPGAWINVGDGSFAAVLASNASGFGAALVGLAQGGKVQDAVSYYTPAMFGAKPGGGAADASTNAKALQVMMNAVRDAGGGRVQFARGGVFYINFPLYIHSNTAVDLNGARIICMNPVLRKGNGGIVIGQSREANFDTAWAAYLANTFPGATTNSSSFTNPAIKQYLRDNQSFVQAENVELFGGTIEAMFDGTDGTWGGYGVNCVNSQHVKVHDIFFKGWTQAIGCGSDTAPETPSNDDCHFYNIGVLSGNLVHTYYAIGFIANSTRCNMHNCTLFSPLTAGTENGSGIATNVVEDCLICNIFIPSLGQTITSEGVLLNNAKGCTVSNISISNCQRVVSTFYTDATFNDAAKPNIIHGISGQGTNALIALRAKYATISDFACDDSTPYDILFANANASNNNVVQEPVKMGFTETGSVFASNYLSLNVVNGWTYSYHYFRPADILLNDKVDTLSWSDNKNVNAKAGVDLTFSAPAPHNFKAVNDVRCFLTFNTGALTAGNTCAISLRRMVAFDGNTGTAPFVEFSNSHTATVDTTQDLSLVAQKGAVSPGYALMADATNGLPNALDIVAKLTLNVNNSVMKEIRVGGWK